MNLRVSDARPHQEQQSIGLTLPETPILSPAATRNLVGHYFEECTRVLFKAVPHQIDGRAHVCPDFSLPSEGGPKTYLECKSIGNTRQALIYSKRLKTDFRLVQTGAKLFYVFWIHNVEAGKCATEEELYRQLSRNIECVLVVPFAKIRGACRGLTPKVMNYRSARSSAHPGKVEMPGYRIPWKLLHGLTTLGNNHRHQRLRVGKVWNTEIPDVEVRSRCLADVLPPFTAQEVERANEMLYELSTMELRVATQPAPQPRFEGQKVWVKLSENPKWYQELCAQYPSKAKRKKSPRHFDTDIRRKYVLKSLERLCQGKCCTPYDWMLRSLVIATAAPPTQEKPHAPVETPEVHDQCRDQGPEEDW